MRKTFKLDEIDCANCARKLQDELAKLDGVDAISVNFMTQKLTLSAADVARAVQESIASAVENTSGLQVAGVNVTVAGVTFQK